MAVVTESIRSWWLNKTGRVGVVATGTAFTHLFSVFVVHVFPAHILGAVAEGTVLDLVRPLMITKRGKVEAAVGGHAAVVELLISAGADINSSNDMGRTPLQVGLAMLALSLVLTRDTWLFTSIALGIILSVSKEIEKKPEQNSELQGAVI